MKPANRRITRFLARARQVVARMRRTGDSLTAAARAEHMDPRTVRRYVGAQLRDSSDPNEWPTPADLRRRRMLIPTSGGPVPVSIRGSEKASQLGRYMSAVGTFLRSGDTNALRKFRGQTIAGHRLITDPETLNYLAQAGALQLDEIYASPESSR